MIVFKDIITSTFEQTEGHGAYTETGRPQSQAKLDSNSGTDTEQIYGYQSHFQASVIATGCIDWIMTRRLVWVQKEKPLGEDTGKKEYLIFMTQWLLAGAWY